jgi:hypothetical protein
MKAKDVAGEYAWYSKQENALSNRDDMTQVVLRRNRDRGRVELPEQKKIGKRYLLKRRIRPDSFVSPSLSAGNVT